MANSRLAQVRSHLDSSEECGSSFAPLPTLPKHAKYLILDNAAKRNALSYAVLQDLRHQLLSFNKSSADGRIRLLPPFDPGILAELERALQDPDSEAFQTYGWLIDTDEWIKHRVGLPGVLVLRSAGPVFCSGHDLNEVRGTDYSDCKALFELCAEVMSLIRRSPAPVIGIVQGLATAAGAQLALTTDLPLAHGSTEIRLPGSAMGLPCISPSTAVSRTVGNSFGYRILALSESHRVNALPGRPIMVVPDDKSLEYTMYELLARCGEKTTAQGQALGKWAYWTHVGLSKRTLSDGYEDAALWAGRVMALFAQNADAREGMAAFLEKRKPDWKT